MGDITRIDSAQAVEITDGVGNSVPVKTSTDGTESGLVTREARTGQQTKAASIPVVIASDQGGVAVASGTTYVAGNQGVGFYGVRNDNAATTLGTGNGLYTPIAVDSQGRIFMAGSITATPSGTQTIAGTVTSIAGTGTRTVAGTVTSVPSGTQTIAGTVTGVPSGTQTVVSTAAKAEDAAHVSGDTGIFVLGVRNDSSTTRTSANGDYSPISVDSLGRVLVAGSVTAVPSGTQTVVVSGTVTTTGGGSGGVGQADKSAFTEGTTSFTPVGGVYNETLGTDPSEDQAAVVRITQKRAIHVNLRSATGTQLLGQQTAANSIPVVIASDQGGSSYAEDSLHASGDTGAFIMGVRNDNASTTFTNANGDYSPIAVDSQGRLLVVTSGGSAGPVDKSSFVEGASTFFVVGGVYNETISSDPTEDQVAAARITAKRGVHVNLRSATGTEMLGQKTMANSIPVVIASDQPGATYSEDAAHVSGDSGVFVMAVRNDSAATTFTSANGDYSPIAVDSQGRVHVVGSFTATPSGTQTVVVAGTVTTTGGSGGTQYAEDATHASGDTGNLMLAVRNDSLTVTTSANGDYSQISVDSSGRVFVTGSVTSVPSGTQTIAGTVTGVPSGTQTIAGTITSVAGTGTRTVVGTVTSVPSGTQTIAGSITSVPSGTQTVAGTVTTVQSSMAQQTGTFTGTGQVTIASITAGNGTAVSIQTPASGFTTATFIFEATDDGTTWYPVIGNRMNDLTAESTFTINTTSTQRLYNVYWSGATQFRCRVTAITATTGVVIKVTPENNISPRMTAGAGVAGTPAGGVLTVQGQTGMTAITVAGSVTSVPSGTQTIAGSVTSVPSGTQTVAVSGTVTTTGGSGGTQYAEDAAHASGDLGNLMLAVRNDSAATTFTSANGDYSPIAVDATGRVHVVGSFTATPSGTQTVAVVGTVTTTGGSGGTQYAEDAAHASGDLGNLMLAVRNDSLTATTSANGDYSQISVDSSGRVFVTGSVTSVPSGTQTIAGSVTAVPSGTQTVAVAGTATVAGTVTSVAGSGTRTVAGTVTSVPSGTQTVAGTVTTVQSALAQQTGTFTGTGQVTISSITVGNGTAVSIQTPASGFTTATFIFEATDDGTTWYPVIGTRLNDVTAESTFTINTTSTQRLYNVYWSGATQFRCRITAITASTGVVIKVTPENNVNGRVFGGAGVAGTPTGGVLTIQGQSGMTAVTVAGSVTSIPSGTQTIAGTVTGVPSGTQTIAGSVTAVPSGTQTVAVSGTVTTTGGSGGTQYAEDAAHASGDLGNLMLAVRNDSAATTFTSANGDYSPIAVDSQGRVHVVGSFTATPSGTQTVAVVGTVTTTGGSGGTQYAEDAAHVSGDTGNLMLAVRNDSLTATTSANGDYSQISVDSSGRVFVTGSVTSVPSGTQTIAGSVTSVPSGTQTVVVSGTVTTTESTTKAEDAAHVSGDAGEFMLAVRNDSAATTFTSANGDYSPIGVDSQGRVWVTGTVTNVPSGTQTIAGSVTAVPSGTQTVAVAGTATVAGTVTSVAGSGTRTVAGTVTSVPSGTQTVAPTGTFTTVNSLQTATSATVNSATSVTQTNVTNGNGCCVSIKTPASLFTSATFVFEASDDSGTTWYPVIGTRMDDLQTESTFTLNTLSLNRLWNVYFSGANQFRVRCTSFSGGGGSCTVRITPENNVQARGIAVGGNIAHGQTDAGNPVKQGFKATTTNPTAVTSGQRADAMSDDQGRQVVILNHVRDLVAQNNITLSTTTETTLLSAGGSGVFHDLTMLTISNYSNSNVRVDIRDATGGTVRMSFCVAAAGGGAVVPFMVPMPQTTANNNWTAQLDIAASDIRIFAQAVKNV